MPPIKYKLCVVKGKFGYQVKFEDRFYMITGKDLNFVKEGNWYEFYLVSQLGDDGKIRRYANLVMDKKKEIENKSECKTIQDMAYNLLVSLKKLLNILADKE